jgi:hypothetical protein
VETSFITPSSRTVVELPGLDRVAEYGFHYFSDEEKVFVNIDVDNYVVAAQLEGIGYHPVWVADAGTFWSWKEAFTVQGKNRANV